MSGVVEYLDSIDREVEMRKLFAYDGTSANLLASRLHRALVVEYINER